MDNSKKIILDLCGGSGSWAYFYKQAGYEVHTITLPDNDVRTFHWDGEQVYGILSAPPCESFSNCRRDKIVLNPSMDRQTGLDIVNACLRIIDECKPKFWALENPATGDLEKYLGKPTMTFQPYEYGDEWAKKTAIWGNFNIPHKIYNSKNRPAGLKGLYVRPGRNYPSLAFQHKSAMYKIPQFAPFYDYIKNDYDLRSITPPKFSYYFYLNNQ